ncbi:MAG TPA: hypothetical protein VG477_17280 [Thermoanaerobaculia bacterium]|nr:hypothetical protein [Thermoanaerobaculia bacterium]
MRKPLIGCFVLSMLGTAAAFAGNVYIPIADAAGKSGSTHVLQVWITNSGTTQRPYSATVLQAETDGTKRPGKAPESPIQAGRTLRIGNLGTPGRVGLLEIAANPQMTVEARLNSGAASGQASQSAVPVISSENLFEASETAVVNGLGRNDLTGEHTNLGIVNLGTARAQCVLRAFRSNGTQISANISLSFHPLSLRHFPDAFGLLRETQAADARFEVSCSQPFYIYAEAVSDAQVFYITPSASGASGVGGSDGGGTPPPTTPGALVVKFDGALHTAAQGNEKKRIDINLERPLTVKKLILDMDFTPGPWNRSKSPGNHAIVWLYREKFRGNTIANVNAFAPKSSLKAAQNIDLGPGIAEAAEAGVAWEQGKRYHLKYTYDAQIRKVSVELSAGGQLIKRLEFPATSPGGVLDIPSRGLIVEFGHWGFEPGPEVASYGWQYSNLKIEFVP